MRLTTLVTLTLALAACFVPGLAHAAKTFLIGDDFAAWRGDTGEWEIVADTFKNPDDEALLSSKPGAGVVVNGPTGRTGHLVSKAEFGDVAAHIEFMAPKGSNSGVYFQGRYEIQVLDSWGVEEAKYSDCGGIYQRWDDNRDPKGYEGHAPRVNASLPPGEWQTFDVVFRAPRFDDDGNKTANACFVKVVHNGKIVHENVELLGPTRASLDNNEAPVGPMMFQGDHGPVAYRNICITLEEHTMGSLPNPFFAMDTGTKDEAHGTPQAQAVMLKELGYAGIGYTAFDGLPEMLQALDANGLDMFTVYMHVGIEPDGETIEPGLAEGVKLLKGSAAMLWITMTSKTYSPSSPGGDARAVEVLRTIADMAAGSGLRIALYPHTGCWLERVEDAVRVAGKVERDNVGATFNLCHWLSVDGTDMKARLAAAMPCLFVVTLNGADREGGWDRLIQTLGRGSFNNAELLQTLKDLDYTGPIGLQGYGIKGDVHENLKRSMEAWRKLSGEVAQAHPAGYADSEDNS